MKDMAVGFLSTGSYLPERVVTNDEIAALIPDVTPEWIVSKTGISTRHWAAPDEATSDLAAEAGMRALDWAGLPASRVDYLIVSTSTGDFPQPPTACLVQNMIGAHKAACFDINVVCAGFVFGVALAKSLVAADPGSHALVIAADVYSRILDFTDKRTAALFGDGAGAAVIGEVGGSSGIIDVNLSSYGHEHDLIKVPGGGSRVPPTAATVADREHFFTMKGRGVRDFVFDNLPGVLEMLVLKSGHAMDEVDHFVPHQANGVMLPELAAACSLRTAQTAHVVDRIGNVGSASVPVALDEAVQARKITKGDLVLMAGFGGGMSVGACLTRWST